MSDDEFNKYLADYWPFLMHGDGVWGGNPETPIHSIGSMEKGHLENSIAMINRWNVKLPEDKADRERLEEIKLYKLNELKRALESK
jgi:hypothetical protein